MRRTFRDGETYERLATFKHSHEQYYEIAETVRVLEAAGYITKVTGDKTVDGAVIWGRQE